MSDTRKEEFFPIILLIASATGSFLEILDSIELKCAVKLNDKNRKYSKRFSDMQFSNINQVLDDL